MPRLSIRFCLSVLWLLSRYPVHSLTLLSEVCEVNRNARKITKFTNYFSKHRSTLVRSKMLFLDRKLIVKILRSLKMYECKRLDDVAAAAGKFSYFELVFCIFLLFFDHFQDIFQKKYHRSEKFTTLPKNLPLIRST